MFSSFVVFWVRNAIQSYLREQAPLVRGSVSSGKGGDGSRGENTGPVRLPSALGDGDGPPTPQPEP